MAFRNALGTVSRMGQWRFRRVLRASLPDGRLDLSDDGLIDFSACSEILLTVTPRPPFGGQRRGLDPDPVLAASMTAGTLVVSNPGIVEALFPTGWSASVPPGLYDARVLVTVGPETAAIFDEPVEIA